MKEYEVHEEGKEPRVFPTQKLAEEWADQTENGIVKESEK